LIVLFLLEGALGDLGGARDDELALGPLRQGRVEEGAEREGREPDVDQNLQSNLHIIQLNQSTAYVSCHKLGVVFLKEIAGPPHGDAEVLLGRPRRILQVCHLHQRRDAAGGEAELGDVALHGADPVLEEPGPPLEVPERRPIHGVVGEHAERVVAHQMGLGPWWWPRGWCICFFFFFFSLVYDLKNVKLKKVNKNVQIRKIFILKKFRFKNVENLKID
jgi:hypothetical protein